MNPAQLAALIRHALTAFGGIAVTAGYLDDATLQAAVGAIMVLAGTAWSILQKKEGNTKSIEPVPPTTSHTSSSDSGTPAPATPGEEAKSQ